MVKVILQEEALEEVKETELPKETEGEAPTETPTGGSPEEGEVTPEEEKVVEEEIEEELARRF